MKMAEYQDYMRLLFDKYIKKVIYPLLIIGAIVVGVDAVNHNYPAVELALSGGMIPLIVFGGFHFLRWVMVSLPVKLFGASNSAYSTIKSDIEEIHE